MAIDFDAIRRKLGQLSGQNSRKNKMWKPEEGKKHIVRIIPLTDNDGQPFYERYFYYNIGNNPGLLTPHQFGKPDPINDLIVKLYDESRANDNKAAYEMAKKLRPKMRSYAAVIVRGEEDKGVRLWAFGKMVYQQLLNKFLDEDYGDLTDVDEGWDVKVHCYKEGDKKWMTTDIDIKPKQTKLSPDSAQTAKWLESVPDLDSLFTLKSYEELEKIVNDWMEGESGQDTSSASSGTSRGAKKDDLDSLSEPDKVAKTYESLDDAFADLSD